MISYISGRVLSKSSGWAIIENNGMGFKVFLSPNDLDALEDSKEVKIHCKFFLKNENPELYGFLSQNQLMVFEMLEKISGIGPKAAMLIAPLGTLEQLKKAVETQDYTYFQNIKGIGTKKIQKIILEISGEIKKLDNPLSEDEALVALTNLGFPSIRAKEILKRVDSKLALEERIKQALRILGNK